MIVETKNAIITAAALDIGDRGFLQGWLTLDYGGTCQGFGGLVLYLPPSFRHHKLESIAGHWIHRVLEVAGVGDWKSLVGKTIRVRANHMGVQAIGHIVKDDWLEPEADYAVLREKPGASEPELEALRELAQTFGVLRQTAPVDDDFPRIMEEADLALARVRRAQGKPV